MIDERMDVELLAALAEAHPEWSIVLVGPIAKIDPAELPRRANLHLLGQRPYAALPGYLRGWDVAIAPFALNAATRFISPTKTPEYLAAGRPVAATPVRDLVRAYGACPAVRIGEGPEGFVRACETALALKDARATWRPEVDRLLASASWDGVFQGMLALIEAKIAEKRPSQPVRAARQKPSAAERSERYDVMVVGAGFAGAVMAERLAASAGKRVLVVDRRPHVAGNAHDRFDEAGVLVHRYGPHIFHTNSPDIFAYLSRFTRWRPYEHRVLADVGGRRVPIPINRTTLNQLYGLDLASDEEAAAFLRSRAEPVAEIRTSADVVISAVGRELYELFFQGYTRKQWGMDPA